jgi:hypothetical protein
MTKALNLENFNKGNTILLRGKYDVLINVMWDCFNRQDRVDIPIFMLIETLLYIIHQWERAIHICTKGQFQDLFLFQHLQQFTVKYNHDES